MGRHYPSDFTNIIPGAPKTPTKCMRSMPCPPKCSLEYRDKNPKMLTRSGNYMRSCNPTRFRIFLSSSFLSVVSKNYPIRTVHANHTMSSSSKSSSGSSSDSRASFMCGAACGVLDVVVFKFEPWTYLGVQVHGYR